VVEDSIEKVFLALYSLEMVLKILAFGFIFGEETYLKDPWNILDFVIVMSAWLT
jgi:Ion transport protein